MSLIKYAKTKNVMDDSGKIPFVQITYLDHLGDAAVGMPYGTHASPKKDSPAVVFQINSDPSNKIIIPLSMFLRNKGLKESEVEIGAFDKGATIKFNEDGTIDITAKGDINIGSGGAGVVTKVCKCALTGGPHIEASSKVFAEK